MTIVASPDQTCVRRPPVRRVVRRRKASSPSNGSGWQRIPARDGLAARTAPTSGPTTCSGAAKRSKRRRGTVGWRGQLRQEPLDPAGPTDRDLVLLGQLVHAEDGDDVLQVLVPLQDPLDLAGDRGSARRRRTRVEDPGRGGQRVHGRVDALVGDRPLDSWWSRPGGRTWCAAPGRCSRRPGT